MDAPSSAPCPRPATILIVEDDPDIRELTYLALRGAGFRVIAATNHADALTALSAVRCDLILADTAGPAVLEGGDRWFVLDALRVAGKAPTFIFSAHRSNAFQGFTKRGFAGFIAKPFDVDALLATVRAALARQPVALGATGPPR